MRHSNIEIAPEAITERLYEELSFSSFDGTSLFYRYWPGLTNRARKKAIILFHRGHEHGARIAHLVDELHMPDYAFFAWDARGLGRSGGERGYAENFGCLVKDVDAFVRHISSAYGITMEDIAVIAQSVGAVAVATWVHDYAPNIRCMVLASPAFKVKLYVPFARQGLALMQNFHKKFFVNSYVKARYLTHDIARIASYETDPLITRPIAVNVLLGLYQAAERVIADGGAIHIPTQLLVSGDDWVVHQAPQHRFMQRLGSTVKETHVLDGFFHDTLGEQNRALALDKARNFLLRMFSAPCTQANFRDADKNGMSKSEYDALSRPAVSAFARGYWAMSKFWIGVGACLSQGLRLGVSTGFDSGSTLDYVYRNQAKGTTAIGRLVDRIYLNSIGWRGIRVRKLHLERLINLAMSKLVADGKPVNIVDIAAGHGRYIWEALAGSEQMADHIVLRDYSPINVEAGHRLIKEKGMQTRAVFEQGDAFDRDDLAAMQPSPTLAVVSGLYELFADNSLIRQSLGGLALAVECGGYLVYTNQPWHPQIELIARTLTSHRQGRAWVMRRRIQAEMDQLVSDAGFEKLDQMSDEWGIFSVSIARRK